MKNVSRLRSLWFLALSMPIVLGSCAPGSVLFTVNLSPTQVTWTGAPIELTAQVSVTEGISINEGITISASGLPEGVEIPETTIEIDDFIAGLVLTDTLTLQAVAEDVVIAPGVYLINITFSSSFTVEGSPGVPDSEVVVVALTVPDTGQGGGDADDNDGGTADPDTPPGGTIGGDDDDVADAAFTLDVTPDELTFSGTTVVTTTVTINREAGFDDTLQYDMIADSGAGGGFNPTLLISWTFEPLPGSNDPDTRLLRINRDTLPSGQFTVLVRARTLSVGETLSDTTPITLIVP
jgi:hypothetical protein